MLSVERKRTDKVDLVKPLTKYIKEQFSKEEAANHELQIQSLQQLREDVRNLQDKTDTSRDLIWRYYSILQSLELRFPISESNVRIYFPWTDTYRQRKYSLYSVYFERSSVLFNYGSLLSQQGATQNRSTVDGIKKACQSFQAAAGVFNQLREYISLHSECCASPDFTADSLNMLSTLMIAQAQECVYEKAVADNLSDSIQSKLAIQVSEYYDTVYQLSNSNALKSVVDRAWTATCYTKVFIYRAIANYKTALCLATSAQFGEQVARLTSAVENLGLARQNIPKTAIVEFREFLDKISAIITKFYESAKKDNDTIYHDIVPPPHKLTAIEKKSIAKPAPVPELIQHDPFIQLIPYSVKEDSAIYNDQKEQLLKKHIDNIKFYDESAKATLISMNLPGAVEALEIGVPKALQEKMDLVKSERGVDTVIDLLKSLQQLHDEDESICTTAKNILNREEEEDNKMSQQYGSQWYRTPSYTLTANLRQDLAKYQSNLQHSTKSDAHIKKKFEDAKPLISALESQHEVVSLLPSNIMPLNQVTEVANLKALIKSLDSLIASRDSTAEKLKQLCKSDDITTKLINPNKDKNQIYREELAKYEPLEQQLNDNILKQEPLLDSIRSENEKFVRSNSKQGSQREELLQKFANAFKTYNELKSNLGEGIQFYTNFQEILMKFKTKCEDFAGEREKEKTELLRQIQTGTSPYSPQAQPQTYPNVQPPPYTPQQPPASYQPYVPAPQTFAPPPYTQGPPQTFSAPPPYNQPLPPPNNNRFQTSPPNNTNNGRYF